MTEQRICRRVRSAIDSRKQGEIILLHDGGFGADRSNTVMATQILIEHYLRTGKRFVSVPRLSL